MSTIEPTDLKAYCLDVAQAAQRAAGELALVSGAQKDEWLKLSARLLRERTGHVLAANALDLEAAPGFGLSDAAIDRLRLTDARIERSPRPWKRSPCCATRSAR
jgi:glutamate-5-semialdehyde dehydrogenase